MAKEKPKAININSENQGELVGIYKQVFSGHPWHEDLICRNALRDLADPRRCMVQYTRKICERNDPDKKKGTIENDCRDEYEHRENIFLLPELGLEKCIGCGDTLELIDFYPDFANHRELITEAVQEPGFIGYILKQDDPIGFTWGYQLPEKRTISVNFPKIIPLLKDRGIKPEKTFYFAESGIIDSFQGQGLGSASIALMLRGASDKGYRTHITRTINPFIHAILEHIFSEQEGQELFEDPERESMWFRWNFEDLNRDYTNNLISRLILK